MTARPATAPGRVRVAWSEDPDQGADALLGDLLGEEVRTVRLCPACGSDLHGRPLLAAPSSPPRWVSLARAGAVTVVAVSTCGPVGVDVEASGAVRGLAGVVHHDAERGQPGELRTWVRKESLLKATGHGLRVDPARIRLTRPDQPPALLVWDAPDPPDLPAHLYDVSGPPDHVMALTVLAERVTSVEVSRTAPGARAPRARS